MMEHKIIFFGTSEIATPSLKALIEKNFKVVGVVTQPDKPQGRKQELILSPVKKLALQHNLEVIQPHKLKLSDIKHLNADLGVLISYGQIISQNILNSFKYGILNIHPSLLPKYRGPSPIPQALLNHDKQTGVTLMKLNKDMDAGPIITQKRLDIKDDDDNVSLTSKLSILGAELLINYIKPYLEGKITPKAQKDSQASYTKIIKKSDGEIKLNDHPIEIISKLKAFTPWPGVYFIYNNKRFKIKKAHLSDDQKLIIDIIQPEGKKDMKWEDFSRGYKKISALFF